MSLHAPRRGRPKGSGIDDQKFLSDIAAMIAAKPDLKPTTAIKALGVTDPSAIRRLRDKFHQFSNQMMTANSGSAATRSAADASDVAAVTSTSTHRCLAAEITRSSDALSALPQSTTAATAPVETAPAAPAASGHTPSPIDLFAIWCGMGLDVISTAMATQAAMTRSLSRLPHVDLALRQQLAVNEMAMAFIPGRVVARTTLH